SFPRISSAQGWTVSVEVQSTLDCLCFNPTTFPIKMQPTSPLYPAFRITGSFFLMLARVFAERFVTVTVATGGSSLSSNGMLNLKSKSAREYFLFPMTSVASRIQNATLLHL